jgi:hypothetical protein
MGDILSNINWEEVRLADVIEYVEYFLREPPYWQTHPENSIFLGSQYELRGEWDPIAWEVE